MKSPATCILSILWLLAVPTAGNSVESGDGRDGRVSHNAVERPKTDQTGRVEKDKVGPVSATIPRSAIQADGQALPRLRILSGHADDVLSLTFLPKSLTLMSASRDKTIRYWDAQTGRLKRTIAAHGGAVRSVAISPDGTTLASAGDDGVARLWDSTTGAQLRRLEGTISTRKFEVVTVAWSPDGQLLAASGRQVVVWNAATGQQLRVPEIEGIVGPTGDYIVWTSNRTLAAAGDEASVVRFWEIDTGKGSPDLTHRGHIHSMSISPDRNTLVTGGHSPYLTFFDLATGTKRIVTRGDPHYWLAWSPDGHTLAAGSILLDSTGEVRATVNAWKKRTSWPMWTSGPVVAWSSDSTVFATVREKDIDLWDTSSLSQD